MNPRCLPLVLAALFALAGLPACGHHSRAHGKHKTNTPDTQVTAAAPALAITGAAAALEHVTTGDEDETYPTLSPDGHLLLFQVTTSSQDANGNAVQQNAIVGVDPAASAARSIFTAPNTQAQMPSWMPDGRGFVYCSDSTGTPAIVRSLAATPNAAVSVIVGGNMVSSPATPRVSPSGKLVAFSTRVRDSDTLAVIGMDGSRLVMLGAGSVPSWSPDEKRLAFVRAVNGTFQIFLVDAATGGNLVQVTSDAANHYAPAFSPDGRYLAFVASAGDNQSAVYVVRPDGTALTQLTSGPGYLHSPHWGKDGWIYFALDAGGTGNHDIWRLMPAGDVASATAQGAAPASAQPPPAAAATAPAPAAVAPQPARPAGGPAAGPAPKPHK